MRVSTNENGLLYPPGDVAWLTNQLGALATNAELSRTLGEAAGIRVRERFGVDDNVCSGDHSCIRLSGCPSLTIKPSADPLKVDPVAHVNNDCVGCGLCGEVAHAAILCPSFFRAEIVQNPGAWDRLLNGLRRTVIGWLQPA